MFSRLTAVLLVVGSCSAVAQEPDYSQITIGEAPKYIKEGQFSLSQDLVLEREKGTNRFSRTLLQPTLINRDLIKCIISTNLQTHFDEYTISQKGVTIKLQAPTRKDSQKIARSRVHGRDFSEYESLTTFVGQAEKGKDTLPISVQCIRNDRVKDYKFEKLVKALSLAGLQGSFKAPSLINKPFGAEPSGETAEEASQASAAE